MNHSDLQELLQIEMAGFDAVLTGMSRCITEYTGSRLKPDTAMADYEPEISDSDKVNQEICRLLAENCSVWCFIDSKISSLVILTYFI